MSHNGLAQKENIESPVVVDPATLVYDDTTGSAVAASRASDNLDSRLLPIEVSAPIGQPHMGLSAEKSFIPSPVIYPSLAAASTPPSLATTSVAPHTPETVFISPQSSASNAFQGLEPLQSGMLMDTSMDFLNVPPLTFSHSDDSMRPFHSVRSPQAFFPGIDDNYSGAHPAGSQQTIDSSLNMDVDLSQWDKVPKTVESHSSCDGEISRPNDNLSQFMQSLGISDVFGSDTTSDQSAHTTAATSYTTTTVFGTSDSQSTPMSSTQPTIDVIMHDSNTTADCHRMPDI